MQLIFKFLAAVVGLYSVLLFIRIIFSWFGGSVRTKLTDIMYKITDPYLDWWKEKLNLRIGFLDLSIIFAIVFVSFIQRILFTLSVSERITIGFILAEVLLSLWSIFSFIVIFFIIIIALRAIAYLTNRNIYSPFWSTVESLSQPVMYKMNRLFFGKKIGGYLKGIILSIISLIVLLIVGRLLVILITGLFYRLPI